MERNDLRSWDEFKQTNMVSRTPKHPCEEPVNHTINRYWMMWVIYTYMHAPVDSIHLYYDII